MAELDLQQTIDKLDKLWWYTWGKPHSDDFWFNYRREIERVKDRAERLKSEQEKRANG